MKKLVVLILIIPIFVGNAQLINTFKNNGNEYKIVAKSSQTNTIQGYGLNIAFSIYKNKKFVHPADKSGGRYVGCRYPFNGAGSTFSIEQITGFGNQTVGWVLRGMYDVCGTSYSSQKDIFIFPIDDTYYSFSIDYQGWIGNTIIKDTSSDTISIWYNKYEWGGRGKPDNYLVPRKINIIKKYDALKIEKGNLMIGNENIKNIIPTGEIYFVSLFNAAIIDRNANLLEYAHDYYFKKGDIELYEIYNIPTNDKEILKIIQTIKDYNIVLSEFNQKLTEYDFEYHTIPRFFNK